MLPHNLLIHAPTGTRWLFATGVTVVSTQVGETVHGMTANAVTSLSLEPMLLLVAWGKGAPGDTPATSHRVYRQHLAC